MDNLTIEKSVNWINSSTRENRERDASANRVKSRDVTSAVTAFASFWPVKSEIEILNNFDLATSA